MDSWLSNSFTSAFLKSVSNFLIPTGFLFLSSLTFIGSFASGENSVDSFLLPISEAIFAYISDIKLGGKSKYKNEIIEKPIINANGNNCTGEKIKLIFQLIMRLQFLWIIIFVLIFL